VAFELFDCAEFYSEYQALEVTRHTPLTDRMSLRYFELPKLPEVIKKDDWLQAWLKLFDAETEEELKQIELMEVPDMQQAIKAYRHITAMDEFKTLERMRSDARRNEASALGNARREGKSEGIAEGILLGEEQERVKWQGAFDEQAALIAELRARLGE
jgi:predicted transposase/invertase (TIGR01784 family)